MHYIALFTRDMKDSTDEHVIGINRIFNVTRVQNYNILVTDNGKVTEFFHFRWLNFVPLSYTLCWYNVRRNNNIFWSIFAILRHKCNSLHRIYCFYIKTKWKLLVQTGRVPDKIKSSCCNRLYIGTSYEWLFTSYKVISDPQRQTCKNKGYLWRGQTYLTHE